MRLRLLCLGTVLLAALPLLGCPIGVDICSGSAVTPAPLPEEFTGRMEGPVSVSVASPAPLGCNPPEPVDVLTSVEGPTRGPVEHSAVLSPLDRSATLTFSAPRPGWYHVTAHFEPGLGTSQRDGYVFAHPGEPAGVLAVASSCMQLQRTARGTWVCDRAVLHDAGVVTLTSVPHVEGDVLWVVSGTAVERFEDAPAGLVSTGQRAVSTKATVQALATEVELLLFSDERFTRIRWDGGALNASAPVSTVGSGVGVGSGVRLVGRTDERAFLVEKAASASGGAARTRVCAVELSAPMLTTTVCHEGPGDLVAHGGGLVWLWDESTGTLRLLVREGEALLPKTSLKLPSSLRAATDVGRAPRFSRGLRGEATLPRLSESEGIVMDMFDAGLAEGVNERFVWTSEFDGEVRYWAR